MSYCDLGHGIHVDKSFAHHVAPLPGLNYTPTADLKRGASEGLSLKTMLEPCKSHENGDLDAPAIRKIRRLGYGFSHLTGHPQQGCCQPVPALGIQSSEALTAEVAHSTWAGIIDKTTNTLRKHSVDLMKCWIRIARVPIIKRYVDQCFILMKLPFDTIS